MTSDKEKEPEVVTPEEKKPAAAKKKSVKKKKTASKKRKPSRPKYKFLVIVESPAKSKTINKILGKDYKVTASMGHIVDLPAGRMGIDFDHDFKAEYTVIKGRAKYLNGLKKDAKGTEAIYLAADPDREGEAICWHLKNQLEGLSENVYRVSFSEITEKAVLAAFQNPRQLDMKLVNAQQARRMLDRIVGYSLSPILWKCITRGLSAGRVQSVAVRLIVEREEEIRKFVKVEYWSVDAILRKIHNASTEKDAVNTFKAKLIKFKGDKIEITDQRTVDIIVEQVKKEKFIVGEISRKNKKSYPRSPYTTSNLQQDAFNKLNFSANKTMRSAQLLYEGVELGMEGSVGLITYMRTDSVRISDDAEKELREFILNKYGDKYLPKSPLKYKSKKRAQEAHEAIRPTLPLRDPLDVSPYLSPDELKLYKLIWKRFISSQMENALFSVLSVNIDAGEYRFRAGGARLVFDGFLRVYRDDGERADDMIEIPELETGEETALDELLPEQHFTKPPPRFTDASLVKTLEEKGIGRPSTYAPIIRTVIARNYVKRLGKSLQPEELGELVNKLLVDNFPDIVDEMFTAKMENELDLVEDGDAQLVTILRQFYSGFSKKLEEVGERLKNVKRQVVETDDVCEDCGKPMVIKWGRRGRFISCSGFPACKNSKSITSGVKCPDEGCEGELVERKSRRGMFYGCTKYPACTYTSRTLPTKEDADDETGDEEVQGG